MARKPSFAVLLPTTAYVLRLEPPPARKLIENQVPVALGSDFNPNAHCLSMPHVMNLACVLMRMTMNEALAAATINAAGMAHTHSECCWLVLIVCCLLFVVANYQSVAG
jgi:imidazolonepropionase